MSGIGRMAAAGVALTALVGMFVSAPQVRSAEPTRPNVLLIVLDDATPRGADDMLADSKARIVGTVGVSYRRSFTAIPSCCPERAALLTGQFPHNSGVTQQSKGATLDKTTTVPADLHRSGYRTYHVGKLVHESTSVDPAAGVFDRWLIGMDVYVDPTFNLDGTVTKISGYNTTIQGTYARRFLADAERVSDPAPWYLSLNFKAPHKPAIPEAKYAAAAVPALTFPDELDRTDKPGYIRSVDITAVESAALRKDMWRTMASVDDQVALTLDWLSAHGELSNTLVVLTSDNGFHHGQNRRDKKFIPYTPAIQVPTWLRGPGVVAAGTNTTRMVSGVDLAATIYDATGVSPSRVQDGESLLEPSARTEVYAEYFNDAANSASIPTWATVRGPSWQYIETYDSNTGALAFREWYNLATDPHMLTNLLADGSAYNDPDTRPAASRLAIYRSCAGASCPH
ncbi:MAG TPA: sulfatase-like hydrolase/transferase [Nocardioidaceae bacterium]|nr:sulfatase-like hydrolase/transferase [Nocardioidaceae bacterium]